MSGTPHRSAHAGFTLLELLVVMTLVGVLMGMGIGFLRSKGGDLDLALAAVRDQVRVAALTARTRHLPTEVVIDPGQDGLATVRARVLEPVGGWHMEADEDPRDEVSGTVEPGRFGMARRPDPDGKRGLLRVAVGDRPAFDLRDGFAIRVDVKLDERVEAVIARLGTSLELRVDRDLVPSAKLVGTEGGGRPGPSINVAGRLPLGTARWHTIELVHDRSALRLLVDGREVDRTQAFLPVLQTEQDVFEVSPADAPVVGLCDEVVLMAYAFSDTKTLPAGVKIAADPWIVAFGPDGDLREPVRFALRLEDDERKFRVGPGGIVE